jgi:uncharacterized membrane protein YoaK (UPF0700 family)
MEKEQEQDIQMNQQERIGMVKTTEEKTRSPLEGAGADDDELDEETNIKVREKMSTSGLSSINILGSVDLLRKTMPVLDIPTKEKIPQQPPLGQRKILEFFSICFGANLLTMNAGFINAVTLLRSGVVVSHITGTLTKSALNLEKHYMNAFDTFWVIPCFICGSFFSSMLINYQTFYLGRAYNRVFFTGTLMLTGAAVEAIYEPTSMRYVYITAVVCGMQNSKTTEYSGGVLRTTHSTGTATDIGIVLARVIKGRQGESWKLFVLIPLLCSFFLGGFFGTLVYEIAPHLALFTNVILFGSTGILYALYLVIYRHGNFFQTLFCTNDLENIFDPSHRTRSHAGSLGSRSEDEEEGGGGGRGEVEDEEEDEKEGENIETEENFAKQLGFISHFIHEDPIPITRRTSSSSRQDQSVPSDNEIPVSRSSISRRSHHEDLEPTPVMRRKSRRAESVECFTPYDI